MKITADANVLVRAAVMDEPEQAQQAAALLRDAELIAVPLPVLCEFIWVLRRGYRQNPLQIVETVRRLCAVAKVSIDRPAIEAGLALLEAGGDFADGVIAHDGRRLGGLTFASFDRGAVDLITRLGGETHLVGAVRG